MLENGYTFDEIEEILADTPGRTNTYVGVKDVEVKVTKELLEESKLAREIQRVKRAGIHKVVLLKDKSISNEELCATVIKIRKLGLQPIIGITGDIIGNIIVKKKDLEQEEFYNIEKFYNIIETSSQLNALAGFRFMDDIDENLNLENLLKAKIDDKSSSILDLMKNSGKEISYKTREFESNKITKAEELFNNKVIFVVEGKSIVAEEGAGEEINFKNDEISQGILKLAEEGRLSLYFATDKEKKDLELATKLVKKIFGEKATKTMISLGTTFTTNMLAELFKKDVASKSFSNAYELGYEALFGNVLPQNVAKGFKDLLTGNKNYEQFEAYMKSSNIENEIFTNNFKNFVNEEISKGNALAQEEKAAILRQCVIGALISYIENHIHEFYKINEDEPVNLADIKRLDKNVKNQIFYRILILLVEGYYKTDNANNFVVPNRNANNFVVPDWFDSQITKEQVDILANDKVFMNSLVEKNPFDYKDFLQVVGSSVTLSEIVEKINTPAKQHIDNFDNKLDIGDDYKNKVYEKINYLTCIMKNPNQSFKITIGKLSGYDDDIVYNYDILCCKDLLENFDSFFPEVAASLR